MDIEETIRRQLVGNIYWKDCQGRYLGCNEAFANICGLSSPNEIIGRMDSDFIKNQTHLKIILNTDQSVIQSGEEKTLEEVGLDQHGNVALYLTKKAPLRDENQNIIGVIGTSINISQYVDMKDYIIRHTTGNVYWKDLQGRYLGCNDSYAELIGLPHPSEIVGKTDHEMFIDTLGKEGVQALIDIDQTVMNLGIEKTIEEVGIDKQGRIAIYMTKKVPMRDSSNKIIGLVGTSLDITKQKQAELTKLEFLRNMSHDIMTPFTGILGISSVLFEDETDPEKKLSLKYLIQSSERLLQLFKQILEVAEFGGRELKLEEFNLADVVHEAMEMISVSARHKGLSLTTNCPQQFIKSDKLRIARILINLLGNAVKFTDTGSIHIEAQCEPMLKICVQDTGTGIPQDKLDIIFEKFRKLTESGKHRNFTGSGIGLYIAKQFALELGGDILVESELGKGSKFTFYSQQKFV